MIEYETRLYHCHKRRKYVKIFEDYEVTEGVRTLVRSSCPNYMGTASDGYRCDGLNDYNLPCGYAQYPNKQ